MISTRTICSDEEYEGYLIFDEKRKRRRKVSGFYLSILEGVHRLAKEACNSELIRPEAIMLSFALTDEYRDYPISKITARLSDRFRKVGKGRKKASTFRLRYLWVRENKYLSPQDPEYASSLNSEEKAVYSSAYNDGAPIPYPHYHFVLILDGHKATWSAVRIVMQRLVKKGIVRSGFHFSENGQTKKKEIPLSAGELGDYMYRASYLAKIDTKDVSSNRVWSMSQ